jgi:hypothetical protein
VGVSLVPQVGEQQAADRLTHATLPGLQNLVPTVGTSE